jgi:hypothetical protein
MNNGKHDGYRIGLAATALALAAWLILCTTVSAVTIGDDACHAPGQTAAVGVRYYWERFVNLVYATFNNRTRMIQLSCVAMALGLFIMFRTSSRLTK